MVLEGPTKKTGRQVVFVILVLKVNGMKKNDDDEPNICHGGFGCCNTKKKS